MSSQDSVGLAGLWQHLRDVGLQELAPTLIKIRVRSVDDFPNRASELLSEGITPWKVELITVGQTSSGMQAATRWDLPNGPVFRRHWTLPCQTVGGGALNAWKMTF